MLTTSGAAAYGRPALEALRAAVASAKQSDLMAPVTILVPNNLAGIVARRHLASGVTGRHPGIAGVYVSTLPRLAEQLAAATLAPRRPASRPIVASAWRSALDQAPGVFTAVRDHPATIRALGRAHQELRQLSPGALETIATASSLGADLVRLHRTVLARLALAWYDPVHLLDAAAARIMASPKIAAELGVAILYLPQDLAPAERRLAIVLHQRTALTVIAGYTGAPEADAAVLDAVDLLGRPDAPTAPSPQPRATRVLHASDSDDEVRAVVRLVVTDLQHVAAHRIAVLYATSSPYARLLHEQLQAAGITINGPGVRSVQERALSQGLLGVLALAARDVPRSDLFRALSAAPTRRLTATDYVPVSRWERISRLAGVVDGDDWVHRLDHFVQRELTSISAATGASDPVTAQVEAAERRMAAADELRQFVAALRSRFAATAEMHGWASLSAWALELFHDLYGSSDAMAGLPAEEQYAAVAIEQALQSMSTLDEFEPGGASLTALRDVLESELESALPRVGRFGEGVFVGPVSAAIGLDTEVTYIVGLAEDSYPGRLRQDALLPDHVRDQTAGELPGASTVNNAKHRHLLAAFGSAPRVVASFPRGDLRRSTLRLPSRWLLPTLRALGGNPHLNATAWDTIDSAHLIGSASFAAEIDHTAALATEQEWRVRSIRSGVRSDDATVAAALAQLSAKASPYFTRFDGNLEGLSGLPDFAHDDRLVSPTQLEAYATCPHAYFVHRLLRIEPVEQPEEIITISPMEIGSLIHDSMDDLVKEFAGSLPSFGEPWTRAQRGRLLEIVQARGSEYEQRGVTGHPTLWRREAQRIQSDLAGMLNDDDDWRAEQGAQVEQSELAFGLRHAPPVVVEVPGGRVRMRGSADLVERTRDGTLLVIDIKTGGSDRFRVLEEDPVAAGTKLQLPVYAYAAQQLLGGDEVEAQYWFVRKDRGRRIPITLTEAVKQTYAGTLATLVSGIAAGHFPAKAPDQPDFRWVQCPYCNPDGAGHRDVRQQWERKRLSPKLGRLVALIDGEAVAKVGDA
ncbi:MAG TPA: PD-(D/E)XK nuclease family protein [Propionibacteriaceae bacterium]|nr:PD-(D/E)XK nuclease family protein [Propionibacteriaceae bacterium]